LANVSAIVALAVLVVGVIVVSISFSNLLSARGQVFDRLEPALVQTEKLRSSLLDQETGIRGFAQTRDTRFLDPYEQGQQQEQRLTTNLRRLLSDSAASVEPRLEEISRLAERWRDEVAAPIIAAPAVDGVDPTVLRSKQAFDRVRTAIDRLEQAVAAAKAGARSDLDTATTSLGIAIGFALAGVTAAGLFGWWLLRRRVIVPIEQLVEQADQVDLDRLDAEIELTGPSEIEQLAARVNEMRERLVVQLAATERAKADLAQQSQSLERSNRDLEQFAYVASHDLQEPLRKVASFCQLIEQRYADQLDEKGRLYIDYAVDGAKRMQALISDLLDFSRVGRNTASFVDCDLDAMMATVIESYSGPIESTGAEVTHDHLPTVQGDPSLLAALLQNLLANALKYRRPDVSPRVHVASELTDGVWTFTFADNGIGIEESFRERVFVIFQRLHSREAFEGTGIGLALCKKIVEFHGGEIWIAPGPPDGGTVVSWTLPVSSAPVPRYHPEDGFDTQVASAPVTPSPGE
jgi:hypothetical protein